LSVSLHHAPDGVIPEAAIPHRSAPRYFPARSFPPYRYVPGLQPHPTRDPAGHSYRGGARAPRHPPWSPYGPPPADWLIGVDLFNAFYFWEAHEAWEGPWAAQPRDSHAAQMLQGLIQIAAALLKVRMGSVAGAAVLSDEGIARLQRVAAVEPVLLGLDLRTAAADFRNYFRPLTQRTLPPLDASVPLLLLAAGTTD
jgi:hypothetical protein